MTTTDATIKRDAYCIAAQVLAVEVLHRRRRHTPYDVRAIAITVHIAELVDALRDIGVNARPLDPEDQTPPPSKRKRTSGRRPRR